MATSVSELLYPCYLLYFTFEQLDVVVGVLNAGGVGVQFCDGVAQTSYRRRDVDG